MTSQELSDLQRDATDWWVRLNNDPLRVEYSRKYIGTTNIKTLSKLEVMYCYLYFKEEPT